MRVRVSAGSGIVLRRNGTARNPAIIQRRRNRDRGRDGDRDPRLLVCRPRPIPSTAIL
jgi:hypothetical protein